jgi:uncharacterized membrane protein YeiH
MQQPNDYFSLLIAVLDGLGSFVFALSGGLLAVQKRFDLFGVLFLSFVAAVTGGVTRDLLIGSVPPAAIANWHTLAIAGAGGLVTFYIYPVVQQRRRHVQLYDAIGLALFAVTGTQKALDFGIDPVMAATLGMMSGIGGGMARDILAAEIPSVLRADIYAVAALAAGGVVSAGQALGITPVHAMLPAAAACLFLRLMGIYGGWRIPVARYRDSD